MLWWQVLLEIIKYTAPSLIVFLTVYYLFREYLNNDRQMRALQLKKEAQGEVVPLRLQAYERLALLCERVKVPNLVLRLEAVSVSARDLHDAMLITIHQETEHNLAQQIYVSKELWSIVELAKNQTVSFVTTTLEMMPAGATASDFRNALFINLEKIGEQPLDTALLAIKKEVKSFF